MKKDPSKSYLIKKALTFALQNLLRNKTMTVATVFVMGIIIFIFNVILGINLIAENAIKDLNKKIDVVVYLKDDTTSEKVLEIMSDIENLEGVEEITHTTKNQALESIKKTHPDLPLAFEKYNLENPLPASLNITTTHPKFHNSINTLLSQEKYLAYFSNIVKNSNDSKTDIISNVSKNLMKLTGFTEQLIFWLIITFVVGGTLIILNALQITIYMRKNEIQIMKLVGASRWFIRLPFLIESIIYAVLAILISYILLALVSNKLNIESINLTQYLGYELIVTIALGAFSSLIAVDKYLSGNEKYND